MHIEFEVRPEDIAVFARFHFKASRTLRRAMLLQKVLLVLAFVISVTGWLRSPESLGYPVLAAACILGFIWIMYGEPRRYVRNMLRMRGEGKRGNDPVYSEMTMHDDGLSVADRIAQARVSWDGIEKVEVLEDHCLLYVSGTSALIIPRATVTVGDYEAFVTGLTNRLKKKSG